MAAKLKTCSLIEQRAVIRFLTAEGVKPTVIHKRMKQQYGESCMSQTSCYRWVNEFKNGREDITDEPRSGRLLDVSSPDTVAEVEKLIKSDRRLTIDNVAEIMDISHGTAHSIVHEKLAFNKVSACWVPKMLTDDHKAQRVMAARECMRRLRLEGDAFLSKIVTTDETWVYHYEPESKRRSMEWKHTASPVKKKFKSQRTTRKVMLTVFWDRNGPISLDFKCQGNTVNSQNYCELLAVVKQDIRNKRRGLQTRGVVFHQDNARPHNAARTMAKIGELGWEVLVHSPYSPDLAPSDFHLFGPLKNHMRGKHFTTDAVVMEAKREWFTTQRPEFYSAGIENLVDRWNKCIEKKGDYVDK